MSPWFLGPWLGATPNREFLIFWGGWEDGRIRHQRIQNPEVFSPFPRSRQGGKKEEIFRVWSWVKILNFGHLEGKNSQVLGGDPKKFRGGVTPL